MCVKVAYVNFNNKRRYDDDDHNAEIVVLFCAVTGSQDSPAAAASVELITADQVTTAATGPGGDNCHSSEDDTHGQGPRDKHIHKGLHRGTRTISAVSVLRSKSSKLMHEYD